MIVFDRKEKEIKVPEGLGNINLTILDANLEDKTVEINEVETTILPSSGYNGMSSLQIDAQPVYDNGYSQGENIGYNSGYTAGDIDGYNRGYNEGETDQKAKLTGITITENGTYSREDGYNEITVDVPDLNGDYNEGYDAGKVDGYNSGYTAGIDYASENAGEIAAANAIDLVATEFGTYYTKYSDNIVYPEVTGVFPNGENFYNYSRGKYSYDTGLPTTENTKIEIWFYNDGVDNFGFYYFKTNYLGDYSFALRIKPYGEGYSASIGANDIDFTLDVGWHHIAMSFADGLVVDGEKISDFSGNIKGSQFIRIGENIDMNTPNLTIGMIKITNDGITNVIIPTADGLLNTITNELLQKVVAGVTYEYINNNPIILDNLIKSVDVQPKVDIAKYGIKFGRSTFAEVPDFYDFSNVTDMGYMFNDCGALQTLPLINTSNVTYMQGMFRYCSSLQTIPLIDTSNVTYMNSMFETCGSLQSLPELDTRNVTTMNRFFRNYGGVQNLTSLPKFNVPKLTDIGGYFYTSQVTMNNLTEVGGWENLNCNWNDNGGLSCLPNLTYQSCINVLNGLADVTELGGRTLKVHPNFLTTVGDEISIAVAKSWTITA